MKVALRKLVFPSVLLFCVALALSCATFGKNTYVTLSTTRSFYFQAMEAVVDLQEQELVTPEKRAEINRVAKIYKEAHNAAVDAFTVYKLTKSAEDKDKLVLAIVAAASKWQSVASLINAIKPGTIPLKFPE